MARIDDYKQAKQIAAESLKKIETEEIAQRGGYQLSEGPAMIVPFLDRKYRIDGETYEFTDIDDESKDVPIQEQVLILHYLDGELFPQPSGKWVAYREIPGATFYDSSFLKRAVVPVKSVFGKNVEGFKKAAGVLKGAPQDIGDACFDFRPFPKIPMRVTLYEGDDEFEPEANIVFDETIGKMLSAEDIAWMAGMVVYRMMALCR